MKKSAVAPEKISAQEWLVRNRYDDVLAKIEAVSSKWAAQGKKTRRNWWDVLAGRKNGSPKTIEGVKFPVLSAARVRKGWPVTEGSLCRNPNEVVPEIVQQARWLNRV